MGSFQTGFSSRYMLQNVSPFTSYLITVPVCGCEVWRCRHLYSIFISLKVSLVSLVSRLIHQELERLFISTIQFPYQFL